MVNICNMWTGYSLWNIKAYISQTNIGATKIWNRENGIK